MDLGMDAAVDDVLEDMASRNLLAALWYLSAFTISCGSQCVLLTIQPVAPAMNDGLPFSVRG